jgi:hypothetical protein
MKVSGQRHTMVPPGKGPWYPLHRRLGESLELVWTQRLEEKFCLCQGPNPGRPVCSQTLYWLSYPSSSYYPCVVQQTINIYQLPNLSSTISHNYFHWFSHPSPCHHLSHAWCIIPYCQQHPSGHLYPQREWFSNHKFADSASYLQCTHCPRLQSQMGMLQSQEQTPLWKLNCKLLLIFKIPNKRVTLDMNIEYCLQCKNKCIGCAMAQAVSCRPLTTEAQVCSWVNPYGLYGGQSGAGTGFPPSSSASPVNIIPPALHLGEEQQAHWWPQSRDIVSLWSSTRTTWTTVVDKKA